jgi:hypothetical protein
LFAAGSGSDEGRYDAQNEPRRHGAHGGNEAPCSPWLRGSPLQNATV